MLAPLRISEEFQKWNALHGAPFGHHIYTSEQHIAALKNTTNSLELIRDHGPFVLQRNNSTRQFEFPWAYHAVGASQPCRVVEIGGGLSGLQFILSSAGFDVTNVDPGGAGFELDPETHRHANEALGTSVRLVDTNFEQANLAPNSVDRLLSISTFEHLTDEQLDHILLEARKVLKSSGLFIMTVDLFLNVRPFTRRPSNRYGRNIPIGELLKKYGFSIHSGVDTQTFGNRSFDPAALLEDLSKYMIGATYPALSQALIARLE